VSDPGSELRDLFHGEAERMDLSPVMPPRVRARVSRVRRLDALVLSVTLVLAGAGVAAVLDGVERSTLPPALPGQPMEVAISEVPLEAGVAYRAEALGGVTFEVDPAIAGTHVHIQSHRLLGIHTSGHDGITVREIRRVHDPRTGEKVAAPEDLVGWLVSHPRITVERAGTMTVGGSRAVVLVATGAQVPRVGAPCTEGLLEPLPCLPLLASRELGGYARADDLIRIYVFERGGTTYSAEAYGTPRRPELAERWDALMRSLRFTD